jgi:hypothetical protein
VSDLLERGGTHVRTELRVGGEWTGSDFSIGAPVGFHKQGASCPKTARFNRQTLSK